MMHKLPNEVLLKIFGYLTYWDLKLRIPTICRQFKALVDESTFTIDRCLFRDQPQRPVDELEGDGASSLTKRKRIGIHPLVNVLCYDPTMEWVRDIEYLICDGCTRGTSPCSGRYHPACPRKPAYLVPAFHENVTSPAVKELVIHVAKYKFRVMITNGDGITVLDVLAALFRPIGQKGKKMVYLCEEAHNDGFVWDGVDGVEVKNGMVHLKVFQKEEEVSPWDSTRW